MATVVRSIFGFPYCPPASFVGQGVTLSLVNEVIASVKEDLNIGKIICKSRPVHVRRNAQSPKVHPACGTSSVGIPPAGSTVHVGEILPGYNKVMVRAEIRLVAGFVTFVDNNNNIVTVNNAAVMAVKFSLKNEVTGVTETIAHFFDSEAGYTYIAASTGLPAHGTPLNYCIDIGHPVDGGIYTFIADLPANLFPTTPNYADYCTMTVTVERIGSASTSDLGALGCVGVRSFSVSQLKICDQ